MIKLKTQHNIKLEKKRRRVRRIILFAFGLLLLFALAGAYLLYRAVMSPNVQTPDHKTISLYIPSHADFGQVLDSLYAKHLIVNKKTFEWVARKKDCKNHVHAGHYLIKDGMNNNRLTNVLRGGLQTPINITFNNLRDVDQLAGCIGKLIEADSASISVLLHDKGYVGQLGFNSHTIPALFLPNTYEVYWNMDANAFVSRMFQEYCNFWNETRTAKANALNLTPIEVSTLASIVDKETNKTDEMAKIAGVYLNRLKSGWLLQADPTLVFIVNDPTMRRVLASHKEIESPYNTYKHQGLPPGPICIPSLAAINAVLNAQQHNYYYFCAKEDLSGYHNFAKTLAEHNRNAAKFQNALNSRGIWK